MNEQQHQDDNAGDCPISPITTELTPEEIRERLLKLSKRGKLPGFEPDEPGAICSVALHGTPFDSKMLLVGDSGRVRFEIRMLRLMPTLFVATLVLTIWPGLPLSDVFLTSFDWYNGLMEKIGIATWHWYIPLTLLPAPFAIRSSLKKSRATAMESAKEAIEKIRSALGS